MPVLVC